MTFVVMRETVSSHENGGWVRDGADGENRAVALRLVVDDSAPPRSGLRPRAMISMLGGEEGEVLSVSWPEAPPGYPLVQAGLAEGFAVFYARVGENPVVGGETWYGAAVIMPAVVQTTPSRLASDSLYW